MFELSDIGIAINGTSNIGFMKQRLKKVYQLDVNALYDECGPINKIHKNIKQKFLWFGSTGAIHKGLDILVDAFRYLPDFQLDVYGASLEEIKDIKLPRNVKIRSKVAIELRDAKKPLVVENKPISASANIGKLMSGARNTLSSEPLHKKTGASPLPIFGKNDEISKFFENKSSIIVSG